MTRPVSKRLQVPRSLGSNGRSFVTNRHRPSMDFARIERDSRPITLSEWNTVIGTQAYFEPFPDRKMINPFTKEEIAAPGTGKAYYVASGKRVGNAALADGAVLTTGIPRHVCEEVAQLLDAKVLEDDRS